MDAKAKSPPRLNEIQYEDFGDLRQWHTVLSQLTGAEPPPLDLLVMQRERA